MMADSENSSVLYQILSSKVIVLLLIDQHIEQMKHVFIAISE